ncbi:3297_t:CDS:2 [Cetraspora pellucida]|uniref:3297_t:CDS:1 n=1 Tax=Cetraspora pellucida TaxID=1433469 RepID=A0ACA9JZT7_9GLOM|nr:3297_t:CDS:2 [Cetraspora pellucida]
MEYSTLCCVCKITPVDVDKLSSEPRSRFCSENCRKEAYAFGLVNREKCRHCGISPRLILSNGRKVDYCGMACKNEAEKQKSSGNSKSSSYNGSGNNRRSSVNLTLTPDKPAYQPKSKPTPLLQNNGPNIKASKSYDNLLSTSSRSSPKRSSTYSSDGYSRTSSNNNNSLSPGSPTPIKRNSLSGYSSQFLTAPSNNFQSRSSHNSPSLRSSTPTKKNSINDVDPLISVKPPSPKRSINDIDPLISITPSSQNSNNNLSPRLPTLTKRRSTNAIEPLISILPSSQDPYSQLNNSSSFINPPPPSHSRRSRPSSYVPTIPLISLIPPSYSTTHTNYNNYTTKKV